MGRRKRMPLCRWCGRRLRHRYNEWHYYETPLERAMLLARHRDRDPTASQAAKGYVRALVGRGYAGKNMFCHVYCASLWAHREAAVQWECAP